VAATDDSHLYQRWGRSFEEDHDDVQVYRPADYPFPRARGRAAIELRPDGTWVEWAVGRGDAPTPYEGRWTPAGEARVRVALGEGERVLEVRSVGPDRLELAPVPA
jgi:hypothetical protein